MITTAGTGILILLLDDVLQEGMISMINNQGIMISMLVAFFSKE